MKYSRCIMSNFIRSNFQGHPFHLVSPSPWPLFTCISLLTLTTSGVLTMHGFVNAEDWLASAFILLISSMFFWFRDVISEGTYLGNHTLAVQRGLNMGIALFIVFEDGFFLAIFPILIYKFDFVIQKIKTSKFFLVVDYLSRKYSRYLGFITQIYLGVFFVVLDNNDLFLIFVLGAFSVSILTLFYVLLVDKILVKKHPWMFKFLILFCSIIAIWSSFILAKFVLIKIIDLLNPKSPPSGGGGHGPNYGGGPNFGGGQNWNIAESYDQSRRRRNRAGSQRYRARKRKAQSVDKRYTLEFILNKNRRSWK